MPRQRLLCFEIDFRLPHRERFTIDFFIDTSTFQVLMMQDAQRNSYTCQKDGIVEWEYNGPFTWTDPEGSPHVFQIHTVIGNFTQCGDFRYKDSLTEQIGLSAALRCR
jgi:hypothetical protein